MKLGNTTQQPTERESYSVNYSQSLTEGDIVIAAYAESSPDGLQIEDVTPLDYRTKFWVSGGVPGVTYKVTVTTQTKDRRTFQDEISFKIKEL